MVIGRLGVSTVLGVGDGATNYDLLSYLTLMLL